MSRHPAFRSLSALLAALLIGGAPAVPGQVMPCAPTADGASQATMPHMPGMPGMPGPAHHQAARCCTAMCCPTPAFSGPLKPPGIEVLSVVFRPTSLIAPVSRPAARVAFLLPFATAPPASV